MTPQQWSRLMAEAQQAARNHGRRIRVYGYYGWSPAGGAGWQYTYAFADRKGRTS